MQNGRVYGEGAYLAKSFALALAFSPHEPIFAVPACRVQALSVVGEFDVLESAMTVQEGVPEGYIVATEVSGVKLCAVSALVDLRGRAGRAGNAGDRCVVRWVKGAWERLGGFGVLVVVYVLALLILGNR